MLAELDAPSDRPAEPDTRESIDYQGRKDPIASSWDCWLWDTRGMAYSAATDRVPPTAVLKAFGVGTVAPERMSGGRGLTWRAGHIVVRPADDPDEASWKSQVLSTLRSTEEFSVPRPIPDNRGAWVRDGWEAWEWIPGNTDESRVDEIVNAGAAFHRAIAGLARPDFILTSDDPWSRADRMVWGEDQLPKGEVLDMLAGAFRPVTSPSQLIHGDLLGNVLFAPGLPPALIDWAPYWRPAGAGAAIAIVDAACWHGYPLRRLSENRMMPEWEQLLVRALAFRIATLHLLGSWDDAQVHRHNPVAAAVVALSDAVG